MKKEQLVIKKEKGFFLIEAILAGSVLVLLITIFIGAFLYSQESTALAGKRSRAVFLAEQGLEAVRNIRDESFFNLVDGMHGLVVSSNQWMFSGYLDVADIFTRSITISSIDADTKQVISRVSWQQNNQRTGEISLTTHFVNLQKAVTTIAPISCVEYCQNLSYTTGTCRKNSVACNNNEETHETDGDVYCTGGQNVDTCCCLP